MKRSEKKGGADMAALNKTHPTAAQGAATQGTAAQGAATQGAAAQDDLMALLQTGKKKPKLSTILVTVGVLAAVGVGAYFLFFNGASKQADSETVYREYAVERGDVTVGQNESSSVSLNRETIQFPVTATVVEVYVKAGSSVKEGDPLIKMDIDDITAGLASYELQADMAALEYEQAKLKQQSKLLEAEQTLENSRLAGDLAETNEELTMTELEQNLASAKKTLADAETSFNDYCALHATFASDYALLKQYESNVNQLTEEQSYYTNIQTNVTSYQKLLTSAEDDRDEVVSFLYFPDGQTRVTDTSQIESLIAAYETQVSNAQANYYLYVNAATATSLQISDALARLDAAESNYQSVVTALGKVDSAVSQISYYEGLLSSLMSADQLTTRLASIKANLTSANSTYTTFKSYYTERYGNIAGLDEMTAKVEDAQLAVEKAELALSKQEVTAQTGSATAEQKKELALSSAQTAATTYELTEMELAQAVDSAKEQYDTFLTQIEEVKELLSDDGIVYAPCNGMIVSVAVADGDEVTVSVDTETYLIRSYASLLVMTNISDVYVPITISEEDILGVSIGQNADVTMTAFPNRTFDAEVDMISVESSRSGAATVSYTVTVKFAEDNELDMYEGMSADVTLIQRSAKDVLYVSNQAVTNTNGVATVLKKGADGTGVVTEVKTGFSDGRYVEIIEGLDEGDTVLVESAVSRQ